MEDPSLEVDMVNWLESPMMRTLEHLKAFHLTVSTLMVELAAVRRTTIVTEKARFQYKLNLAKAMRQAKPLLEAAASEALAKPCEAHGCFGKRLREMGTFPVTRLPAATVEVAVLRGSSGSF